MADVVWFTGDQFFDDNGDPLNAGTIEFYDATTTNPRTVYQNSTETTSWGTSLTLDSAGRLTAGVFVPTGAWKYILKNSSGTIIATQDNIPGAIATTDADFARPVLPILTKATTYTVVAGDLGKKINADATGGDFTITLLSAITAADGGYLVIQNIGATGTVTVATSAAQTINGASTIKLRAKDDSIELVSDGANWTATVASEIRTALAKLLDYDVVQSDFGRTITFDVTVASRTATLLAAATAGSGFWFRIQKIDSSANTVTIDGNASETINGATTYVLGGQWQGATFYSDGANWLIVGHFGTASTSTPGVVEFATEAEAAARTSTSLALSAFSNPFPTGHLFGLTLSNNVADATNDIDIAAGSARDSTDAVNVILASALTKQLDVAWAVGTAQGGLDTGSIANTTYHIWLIKRSDTGVVDALFSTSATAPTMPASYDYKRRLGSILRSGGAIVAFSQRADEFRWDVPIRNVNAADPGTAAVTRTLSVPLGIVVEALVTHSLVDITAGGATYGLLTALAQTDTGPTAAVYDIQISIDAAGSNAKNSQSFCIVKTNTSAQIRSRLSASTADHTEDIITHGWRDLRGRLA